MLDEAGMNKKHTRSVARAVRIMKKNSVGKITESKRRVESYIRYLNGILQYASLLL